MIGQKGLREFVAVVEQGGFTAAAEALEVSTSFVSRQVRRLEERLATRLLHRTTRAVRLTDMGRIYYERSREILDRLKALEDDMADSRRPFAASGSYVSLIITSATRSRQANSKWSWRISRSRMRQPGSFTPTAIICRRGCGS